MDYGGASKNAKSKQGSARQANQSYNYYDACQISRCKTDMSRDLDEVFPNAIKPFLDPGRSDLGSDCCTLTLLPKGRRKAFLFQNSWKTWKRSMLGPLSSHFCECA